MGQRKDNEFWQRFQDINNAPDFVKSVLNEWEYDIPSIEQFRDARFFTHFSWWEVAYGLKRLNTDLIKSKFNNIQIGQDFFDRYAGIKHDQQMLSDIAIGHGEFLNSISRRMRPIEFQYYS